MRSRPFLAVIIFLLYFLPTLFWSIHNVGISSFTQRWELWSIGLLLSVAGSIIWFLSIINSQEPESENPQELSKPSSETLEEPHHPPQQSLEALTSPSSSQPDPRIEELTRDLEQKSDEIKQLVREKSHHLQEKEKWHQDIATHEKHAQEMLLNRENFQQEYLKTISEQREIMEQQEQHILKLDSQVRDLKYEIKTLLQLAESQGSFNTTQELSPSPKTSKESIPAPLFSSEPLKVSNVTPISFGHKLVVPTTIEANLQLKRCIDIAQKMTSSNLFGNDNSRFKDLSVNSYSIDLRRLFDSLRSENSNAILLYSQKEEKLLFVNNHAKNLLGWSPEKFIQDFPNLIVEGASEWKQALGQVTLKNEAQLDLVMKSKLGQQVSIKCQLGFIPTGLFKGHVIGILYPA